MVKAAAKIGKAPHQWQSKECVLVANHSTMKWNRETFGRNFPHYPIPPNCKKSLKCDQPDFLHFKSHCRASFYDPMGVIQLKDTPNPPKNNTPGHLSESIVENPKRGITLGGGHFLNSCWETQPKKNLPGEGSKNRSQKCNFWQWAKTVSKYSFSQIQNGQKSREKNFQKIAHFGTFL